MPSLEASEVTVTFGGRRALDGVAIAAEPGRVTGLIGPNGAGKSTLFDVICGLRRPVAGRIRLDGKDVTRQGPARRARHGMARTFQRLELFGRLSVRENLMVAAELGPERRHPARAVDEIIARLNLAEIADRPADALPTGTGRLVEVGRALAVRPRFLLLDEPAAGQDAEETSRFAALLRALADEGTTVVLVEHDMSLVMGVCDEVYVLDLGKIISVGPPDVIRRDETVLAAYLGDCLTLNLLELRGVRAAYDGVTVLHGVDLAVAAGQVVALLGPNGAGKTTTLRIAAGVHPVQSGRLLLGGRDMAGAVPRDLARAGVCLIPEGRGVFPNLSIRDNLLMMTYTGRPLEQIEEFTYTRFPVLGKHAARAAGTLSGGEQQMLALARGLATDPAVLLLDELSMGLAPVVVSRLYEHVAEIASQGVAVLLVEQFATAALSIADYAAVLVRGRVALHGRPDDTLRAELSDLYLGSSR